MFDFNRFEALREEKGVSKSFIAQKLDRTASICHDWKAGKSSPNEKQIQIVAKILGTSPEYLKGETEKNPPPKPARAVSMIVLLWRYWEISRMRRKRL